MTVAKPNNTTIDISATINNSFENEKKNVPLKMEVTNEDEITLEDLAPDGGWGWMIALAMILIFISTVGPTSSFAIIFGDFIENSGKAGMANSLFNSVFMITFSIASLLINSLLKRYSARAIGITGALVFAVTDIALILIRNIYDMAILFFLQGFGLGFLVTICNTIFNAYFVKRRAKVMSASQVIIALGGIIFPKLTEKMMTSYGFRGTVAIMGAISLNSIVGMCMMHPVEWHAKKPEEIRAERARKQELQLRRFALSNRRSTIDVIHVSSKTKWSSLRSLKGNDETEAPLLSEAFKPTAHRVASISAIEDGICEKARSESIRGNLTRRMSALAADIRQHREKKIKESQADMEIQEKAEKQKEDNVEQEEEKKYKIILRELLDMSLVKNLRFLNLCFGVSFVCTSDFAFSSLLPLMMTDAGYTKSDAALTITVSGIAELLSKVLLAIFTLIVDVKAKYLFLAAMIFMQFARIGFLLCEHTLMGVLIMTGIIGIVRSWLLVLQPLVIIEDIRIEKFASAYGINSVINGLVTIVFGAIVGYIKDWTGSYQIYQVSLLVLNGAFVIPWALQFICIDLKKWRKQRKQKINSNSLFINHE